MQNDVTEALYALIDQYIEIADLNHLMKASVDQKKHEQSIWASQTELIHRMFGGDHPKISEIGALTEAILLALDMMDDLQDGDNPDVIWMKSNQAETLNGFMAFLFAAFAELGKHLEAGANKHAGLVLERLGSWLVRSVIGQHKDVTGHVHTEEDYIYMVQEKSGSLIRLSFHIGLCQLEVSTETEAKLDELAYLIGILAQIDNDLRDVLRHDAKSDLFYKKKTLPVFYLLRFAESDFPPLKQYYENEISLEQFQQHMKRAGSFIEDSGCIEYCQVIQSMYLQKAKDVFQSIDGDTYWKAQLSELLFRSFDHLPPPPSESY